MEDGSHTHHLICRLDIPTMNTVNIKLNLTLYMVIGMEYCPRQGLNGIEGRAVSLHSTLQSIVLTLNPASSNTWHTPEAPALAAAWRASLAPSGKLPDVPWASSRSCTHSSLPQAAAHTRGPCLHTVVTKPNKSGRGPYHYHNNQK